MRLVVSLTTIREIRQRTGFGYEDACDFRWNVKWLWNVQVELFGSGLELQKIILK